MADTIDVSVTFEAATKFCLAVLRDGTPEGKRQAEAELLRYARELDRLAAQSGAAFDAEDTAVEES